MFPWEVLITGAVGVGGTALGAWLNGRTQAKTLRLSLNAENERARLADKRSTYARCLGALPSLLSASLANVKIKKDPESSQASRLTAATARRTAYLTALNLVFELELIAPSNVSRLAYNAALAASDAADNAARLINDVRKAMRADLGETD